MSFPRLTAVGLEGSSARFLAVAAFAFVLAFFGLHKWNIRAVLAHDTLSYYSYLPATFLYGDPAMHYLDRGDPFWQNKVSGHRIRLPDGSMGRIQKYTMGLSILYLPFFLLACLSAWALGFPVDGFSAPFMFWIQFGALFYVFWGLWHLRKLLLRQFNEQVTTWTLAAVLLGSNLLYYTLDEAPMPHAYLFGLIAGFAWWVQRFLEAPTVRSAWAVGLLGGLIVLTRPNQILIWFLPLLYGVSSSGDFRERLRFLWTHKKLVGIWLACSIALALPQMWYWHHLSGQWLRYSYTGEGFYLLDPAWIGSWFSFRKGWLVWTPIMALALAGLLLRRRQMGPWRWAVPAVFLPAAWLAASWWCWWWGGSFGNRGLIDLYALLAIPMAAVLAAVLERHRTWWRGLMATIVLLCGLNLFQSYQYHRGIIHWDSMSGPAYWSIFGRLEQPDNFETLLEHPDYEAARLR